MAALMRLPNARADGLSRRAGRPAGGTVATALALGAAPLAAFGLDGLAAALLMTAVVWAVARLACAKIGGQTGDVLGAGQQVAEIAVLAALTAR